MSIVYLKWDASISLSDGASFFYPGIITLTFTAIEKHIKEKPMFILDPVKEADRKARIENEPNIDKQKEINDYGEDAKCKYIHG